jgi:hypothetical protein
MNFDASKFIPVLLPTTAAYSSIFPPPLTIPPSTLQS